MFVIVHSVHNNIVPRMLNPFPSRMYFKWM